MVNVGETESIGGHMVTRVPDKAKQSNYECNDCGEVGTSLVFTVGIDGCPGRPESLNNLKVCPGGDNCWEHMDQSSALWRQWKESSSMPADSVPHYRCKETERGDRAAAQFKNFADRLGMTTKNWTLNTGTVFNINVEAMRVAEFDHENGHYELFAAKNGTMQVVQTAAA